MKRAVCDKKFFFIRSLKASLQVVQEKKQKGTVAWKTYVEFLMFSKSRIRIFVIIGLSIIIQLLMCMIDVLVGWRYVL